MNWIPNAKVGDKFRWLHDGTICKIIAFRDNTAQVNFSYETGPHAGGHGYTLLPADIELLTILDELAGI